MEEEILDVVDEKDFVVRKATRQEVREKGLLYRSSRVIILNSVGELLVQKRSSKKDIFSGYWDIGVAETVISGEDYETAAWRGLEEETGVTKKGLESRLVYLFDLRYRSEWYNENSKVYKLVYDGNLTLDENEVEKAQYLSIAGIKGIINHNPFHPSGKEAFEKYLKILE